MAPIKIKRETRKQNQEAKKAEKEKRKSESAQKKNTNNSEKTAKQTDKNKEDGFFKRLFGKKDKNKSPQSNAQSQ